jgi:hypothetical protein
MTKLAYFIIILIICVYFAGWIDELMRSLCKVCIIIRVVGVQEDNIKSFILLLLLVRLMKKALSEAGSQSGHGNKWLGRTKIDTLYFNLVGWLVGGDQHIIQQWIEPECFLIRSSFFLSLRILSGVPSPERQPWEMLCVH